MDTDYAGRGPRSSVDLREALPDTVRVLHVDDNADFLDVAAAHLELEGDGFEVATETGVAAGLDRLEAGDVDCVVSDYDMPRRDGLGFLAAVREQYPDLPFILFTGKGSEEIASEAVSAGVTDYLQKERGTDQYAVLANRIRNAVARREAESLVYRCFRAMDNSREGIALLDEDGEFIYVNRAYADIVGYDPGELLGEFWELVYPEEQVQRVYEEILPAVPEQGRWTGDTVYRHKDGERILVNHALAYSEEGTMICLLRDLSDSAAQRRALREQRERFDLFVDAVEDYAIFMLDPDGYIISWNRGAERIKGYTENGILGSHFSTFYTEDQRDAGLPERLLARALEDGSAEHRGPRVRADGTTFQAHVVITAVFDENGTHRGFVKVTRDLSERRTADDGYRRQLFEEFGEILSHDLTNPLNVARGRLELARETGESEHLEAAADALARVEALVDDLSTVAKEGALVSDLSTVDAGAVLEAVWGAAPTGDASLVVDGPVRIRADEDALSRLFDNLVHNAVEHAGDDVTVRLGPLDGGFYVADDGPGIPEEDRDDVFEPGFTTTEDGTGFGLFSVRHIALAHGWDVHVRESDGGGARFEFTGVGTVR